MLRNYVLLSSVYMRLLRGSHNSLEIEQHSDEMTLGLRFFQVCLHFRLRFWQRGGKFKSLIIKWPCGVVVACLPHTQEVPSSIPGRGSYLRQVSLH